MGRFLNADALVSTGQGTLGNNMFAYCLNNPVVLVDPSGNYCVMYHTGQSAFDAMNGIVDAGGGGGQVGPPGWNPGVNIPKLNLNAIDDAIDYITNTDEEVVLKAKHFAFYKGVPVIKADLGNGGALSFGIIIIDDGYICDDTGINVVKHEYGHILHFRQLGPVDYFLTTAIPSLLGAHLTNKGILPGALYYSLPWEHIADQFGGAYHRGYTTWANDAAVFFWLYTIIASR